MGVRGERKKGERQRENRGCWVGQEGLKALGLSRCAAVSVGREDGEPNERHA